VNQIYFLGTILILGCVFVSCAELFDGPVGQTEQRSNSSNAFRVPAEFQGSCRSENFCSTYTLSSWTNQNMTSNCSGIRGGTFSKAPCPASTAINVCLDNIGPTRSIYAYNVEAAKTLRSLCVKSGYEVVERDSYSGGNDGDNPNGGGGDGSIAPRRFEVDDRDDLFEEVHDTLFLD